MLRSNSIRRIRITGPLPSPQLWLTHFSTRSSVQSHENPLGLPRSDAPPTIPRMQRGLPTKRKIPGCKRVVVVSSGKGGVGKSSIAANLALSLSNLPNKPRIGLLDLDIFGPSIPKLMGLEGAGEPILTSDNRLTPMRAHGIECMSMGFLLPNSPEGQNNADTPVVWRGMMVMKAVQQLLFDVDWNNGGRVQDLDVLVIDTPPGTGDVALSLGQLIIVDGAVIVSTPQDVAIIDTRKGVAMFRKIQIPIIGAVLNMAYFLTPGTSETNYIFGPPTSFQQTCKDLSLDILAEIPMESKIASTGDLGSPLMTGKNSPSSTSNSNSIFNRVTSLFTSASGEEKEKQDKFKLSTEVNGNESKIVESSLNKVELEFHLLANRVWGKIQSK